MVYNYSMERKKYTTRQTDSSSLLGYVTMHRIVLKNPYFTKYNIEMAIDAKRKWEEIEANKQMTDPTYKSEPCPLTSAGIKWLSAYFYLYFIKKENGDSNNY